MRVIKTKRHMMFPLLYRRSLERAERRRAFFAKLHAVLDNDALVFLVVAVVAVLVFTVAHFVP